MKDEHISLLINAGLLVSKFQVLIDLFYCELVWNDEWLFWDKVAVEDSTIVISDLHFILFVKPFTLPFYELSQGNFSFGGAELIT